MKRTGHATMSFDAVVFSGGGCRCFWQAGFWAVAAPGLDLRPKTLVGASAGSAFACAAVGGTLPQVVDAFRRRTAANPRNVYPRNLLRRAPVFPHERMYRGTILETTDEPALARIHAGPDVRVLVARPPRRAPVVPALLAGVAGYVFDGLVRRKVHTSLPRRLGFRPHFISVRECSTKHELADLIMHSSCFPPLTPLYRRDGRTVIDGAIIDRAMVEAVADHASTLVLLTRRFEQVPEHPGRLYVQPSAPIPIAMWDYASPELIEQTFDLGRRDGEAFVRRMNEHGGPHLTG